MATATYAMLIDWDNDGTWLTLGEDVTTRTLRVEYQRGRDVDSQVTGRSVGGSLQAILNNESGDYNSFLSTGPLYGSLLPGRKVALRTDSYYWQVVKDNPAAYWRLGETSGTLAADETANGNTGTYSTDVTLGVTGPLSGDANKAASFGVGTARVSVADATAFQFTGTAMSMECWIRPTSLPTVNVKVLDKGANGAYFFRIIPTDGTNLQFFVRTTDGAAEPRVSGPIPATGTWTHAVITYDGTNLYFYINGSLYSSTGRTGAIGGTNGSALFIGSGANSFPGTIDEVALYATALGSARVLAHYEASTYSWPNTLLWQGYIDRIVPLPSAKGLNTARIEAIGPLTYINQQVVSGASANLDTGAAINALLTQAGWATGTAARDVDTGKTTMVRWWTDRKRTIEAMREVEETEAGFLRESADGKIVFENRWRRLTSPYTTSQATWSDDPTSTLVCNKIEQEDPLPQIFTEFEATLEPYTVGATGTLWKMIVNSTNAPQVGPGGGTLVLVARYPGPTAGTTDIGVDTWIAPTATVDYNVTDDIAGTGTNLNGSMTVTGTAYQNNFYVTLTNNGSRPGYVTFLQARGLPLQRLDKTSVVATSTLTAFGKKSYPTRAKFIPSLDEAKDWADWNLSIYQTAVVRLSVMYVANRSTAALTQAMARDISDRVTVTATGTTNNLGINRAFYIEALKGVIYADRKHEVTYYLSDAVPFSDAWVLDVSALDTQSRLGF